MLHESCHGWGRGGVLHHENTVPCACLHMQRAGRPEWGKKSGMPACTAMSGQLEELYKLNAGQQYSYRSDNTSVGNIPYPIPPRTQSWAKEVVGGGRGCKPCPTESQVGWWFPSTGGGKGAGSPLLSQGGLLPLDKECKGSLPPEESKTCWANISPGKAHHGFPFLALGKAQCGGKIPPPHQAGDALN